MMADVIGSVGSPWAPLAIPIGLWVFSLCLHVRNRRELERIKRLMRDRDEHSAVS